MQKVLETVDKYAWWSALNHGGLLIAPTKLGEFFVEELTTLPRYQIDRLRRDLDLFAAGEDNSLGALLDTVLEGILGLSGSDWQKGNQVEPVWSQKLITGEVLKPRRVWQGYYSSTLPVFTADGTRLGIGKGRRAVSRVIEWLRRADQKIAVLTNGKQWRLIHAGSDYDAWCETDSSLWFEEGQLGLQITAWRSLLSTKTLTASKKGELSPLLAAISASRQGQADLSEHLGERVRLAVELLIQETLARQEDLGIDAQSLYLAATRIVMRCVFILFAEARDLLPRDNAIYNRSYSLQGLREQLDRVSGGRASEALRNRWSAYPRLLALFSLVYHGCSHEALPIPQYSGGLFKPGSPDSSDRVLQALALFEKPQEEQLPCDEVVYKILELLTRSPVKVRQGRKTTWVTAPVDFSDLSSEYIGILYEGLLDFELRQADPENPMIFLNLGNQPVLPLSRLEEMDDTTLESLVEKLKKEAKSSTAGEESEESEEEEIVDEGLEEEDLAEEEMADLEPELLIQDDQVAALRDRAHQWAIKAVKVGKLVAKPKGKKADALGKYEAEVSQLAKRLIARIILPGEWFLVRWGGTRKGSGTFYTRPQLAIPTVRRTLEPLVYQQTSLPSKGDLGELKIPADILALKICDPACGSASFPVAALRYLTEALWDSLFTHAWLIEDTQKGLIRVGIPQDAQPAWFVQVVEDLPLTAEKAEEISKAKLRRYVVENCIYGVDINPLAVELGRLALWVETMDKSLPFTFLDHKIKCGNALVGCWFDRFQDYPVMAWERKGGDENHTRFVNHFREAVNKQGKINKSGDKWTQAIKDLRNGEVKSELKGLLETLHSPDSKQLSFEFPNFDLPQLPEAIHDEALAIFNEIHAQVNDPNQQEEEYRQKIKESDAIKQLKFAFDSWCAVWFWEGDLLEFAPTPNKFFNPPEKTRKIIQKLASQYQFFHWELEFPDVFTGQSSGFNGVVGNPPWEIQKPNSMEFFSNIDPLYRTYGKQEALQKQLEFFENDPEIEKGWLAYCDRLKALSNWTKNVGFPFGDPAEKCGNKFSLSRSGTETTFLHELWRNRRLKHKGYADPRHPFIFQGSADINTYKMFLELSLLLLQKGGRMGLIVPSGIYTDKGSTALRTEFLEFNQWDWIFGIINWNKIFSSVYYRFKFCITIIQKGGVTSEIKSAFSRYHIEEWENAEKYIMPYSKEQVKKFSPKSKSLLETRTKQDLDILEKIYSNSVLLGDDSPQGWDIKYATEFHMTSDSKLFPPRPKWEGQGYIADEYGHWLKGNWQALEENQESWQEILNRPEGVILSGDRTQFIYINDVEDITLPLYEGRMIGQFDFSEKGWVSGKGRSAEWRDISFEDKVIEPQYCIALKNASIRKKVSFMDIASSTNMRTMVASINYFPCGNSSPILETKRSVNLLISILNSITYDYVARSRCGGLHLNYFVIEETALLNINLIDKIIRDKIEFLSSQIILISPAFSRDWLIFKNIGNTLNKYEKKTWQSLCSVTPYERLRLRCILDALIAELYSLTIEDFSWVLHNCDQSTETMHDKTFYRTLDPKGFWRVDKEKDPELRHTVLSLVAFHELKKIGLDAFLNLNDGEGWILPKTLRLADYGLGHDDRAKQPKTVTNRFTLIEWDNLETPQNTPINYRQRFYPWQLAKTPEQSWAECERHAENLRLLLKQDQLPELPPTKSAKLPSDPDYQPPTDLFGNPLQVDLFGNVIDR